MQNLIKEYLLQHKNLPILGLGNLIFQNNPAIYAAADQTFLPPGQKVVFVANPHTDASAFLNFMVNQAKMEFSKAQDACKKLANAIDQLVAEEKLTIAHAGYFTKNSDGVLLFHSFVLSSVFYPPVEAKKVIRPNHQHTLVVGEAEVTNVYMNELLTSSSSEKKYHWWIAAVCMMMIAVSLLLVNFFKADNGEGFGNNQPIEIKKESTTYQLSK